MRALTQPPPPPPSSHLATITPRRAALGRTLVSGSLEIHCWDTARAENQAAISSGAHVGSVVAVTMCSDQKTALSIGKDGMIKVWNVPTGAVTDSKRAFRPADPGDEPECPRCIGVSSDDSIVAVGTDEGAMLIWEFKAVRGGPRRLWPLHEKFVPHNDRIVDFCFADGDSHDVVTVSEVRPACGTATLRGAGGSKLTQYGH